MTQRAKRKNAMATLRQYSPLLYWENQMLRFAQQTSGRDRVRCPSSFEAVPSYF